MPGITGCSLNTDFSIFEKMTGCLYRSEYLHEFTDKTKNLHIFSLEDHPHILSTNDVTVAFDGFCVNVNKKGDELLTWFIESYLSEGELFVKNLRGSFKIVIQDGSNNSTLLYTDYIGSRPLFYYFNGNELFFSSEIFPIISVSESMLTDKVSLMHFMVAGYFPSGRTLFKNVNVLNPGKYIVFKNGRIDIKQFYKFEFNPPHDFQLPDFMDSLNDMLETTIIEYWRHATKPAILLSGGIDSQVIFYHIADYVDDTTQLTTVTWGQNKNVKKSDVEIAAATAKRFGTRHIFMEKSLENFEQDFTEMFSAQSGMTDTSFIHSNELTVVKRLRKEYEILSLFRGDHCFGRDLPAYTMQNVLLKLYLSYPRYIPDIQNWFDECHSHFIDEFSDYLEYLISSLNDFHYNDIEDILFFYNRKAMYLQFCNYFKYHTQQVYNPLMDVNLLNLQTQLPSHYRGSKSIYERSFFRKFDKKQNISIAAEHNMIDWDYEIYNNQRLRSYFNEQIRLFPAFLNKQYFRGLLEQQHIVKPSPKKSVKQMVPLRLWKILKTGKNHFNRKQNVPYRTSSFTILARAVILSRWFNSGIQLN